MIRLRAPKSGPPLTIATLRPIIVRPTSLREAFLSIIGRTVNDGNTDHTITISLGRHINRPIVRIQRLPPTLLNRTRSFVPTLHTTRSKRIRHQVLVPSLLRRVNVRAIRHIHVDKSGHFSHQATLRVIRTYNRYFSVRSYTLHTESSNIYTITKRPLTVDRGTSRSL